MDMPPITDEQLTNWFEYHAPTEKQIGDYFDLRRSGHALAMAIRNRCPPCVDTTAAIRKVREAVMTANAAIACGGK